MDQHLVSSLRDVTARLEAADERPACVKEARSESPIPGLAFYFRQVLEFRRSGCRGCSAWELARLFVPWRLALRPEANPLKEQRPWLTFPAITLLERIVSKRTHVFEFGSGGSTLFFARRAAEVISVEHDAEWCERVRGTLEQHGYRNVRLILASPEPNANSGHDDPADPVMYVSSAPRFRGQSFRNYVGQMEKYDNECFDVLLVDGRARPACVHRAMPKVKPGGWLLLDNAEREHYQRAAAVFEERGWRKRDLSGPGPYHPLFWRTWAWQKPGVALA